jgi:hypothetical protein
MTITLHFLAGTRQTFKKVTLIKNPSAIGAEEFFRRIFKTNNDRNELHIVDDASRDQLHKFLVENKTDAVEAIPNEDASHDPRFKLGATYTVFGTYIASINVEDISA